MNTAKKLTLGLLRGSGAGLLPFSDDFARADGDVGNGWDYSAGIWTISSGTVVADPGVGAELVSNSNCETGDPPTGYGVISGSTLSAAADERTGGVGVQSLNIARGTGDSAVITVANVTPKRWYRCSTWLKNITSTSITRAVGIVWYKTDSTSWVNIKGAVYQSYTSGNMTGYVFGAAGVEARMDDVSLKEITTADLFMTRDFLTPNVRASIALAAMGEDGPAGLVLCADSATNPQNYIVVIAIPYNNLVPGPVKVVYAIKFVNGMSTNVATQLGLTYVPGVTLSAEFAGTTLRLFRDGVQLGVDYTVSDAEIIGNTRHGLFNADPSNNLGGFGIV